MAENRGTKKLVTKILNERKSSKDVEEAKFAIDKIQDVYFNIHELIEKIEPFVINYYKEKRRN